MTIAIIGAFLLYVGITTLNYDRAFIHFPEVWAVVFCVTAGLTLLAAFRPTRLWVALAGATIMVAATGRSLALVEAAIVLHQPSPAVTASFWLAGIHWATFAYVSWVLWRRVVVPWAVVTQGGHRDRRL